MYLFQSYVLLLNQDSDDLRRLEFLLKQLKYPTIVARSADQAVARASQTLPYLVILSGDQQSWTRPLIQNFRNLAQARGVVIVALTDSSAASWQRQEDHPGLDGFLVKPLQPDVLVSLIQSAWARRVAAHAMLQPLPSLSSASG